MRSVPQTATATSSRNLPDYVEDDEASERSAPAPLSAPAYDRLAQVATQIAEYARIAAGLPNLSQDDALRTPAAILHHHLTLRSTLDTAICELAEAIVREVQG